MRTFQVGDKVKVIADNTLVFMGKTGNVSHVRSDTSMVHVRFDVDHAVSAFFPHELAALEQASSYAAMTPGNPSLAAVFPSTTPSFHAAAPGCELAQHPPESELWSPRKSLPV
jgi:hypothetical protein